MHSEAAALRLARPTPQMEQAAMAFIDSFFAAGEQMVNGSAGLDIHRDYGRWLRYLAAIESGEEAGLVPSEVWFALEGEGQIVGVLDIRPRLPKAKRHFGHLGYAVAPARRGRGVATFMLQKGMAMLRRCGVGDVLAACYATNAPSRRVLEKGGFVQAGSRAEHETGKTIVDYINKMG